MRIDFPPSTETFAQTMGTSSAQGKSGDFLINPKNLSQSRNDSLQLNNDVLNLAPVCNWSEMNNADHFVQFYETDPFLLNSLSGFVGAGLKANESVIVVATENHRQGLEKLLLESG